MAGFGVTARRDLAAQGNTWHTVRRRSTKDHTMLGYGSEASGSMHYKKLSRHLATLQRHYHKRELKDAQQTVVCSNVCERQKQVPNN